MSLHHHQERIPFEQPFHQIKITRTLPIREGDFITGNNKFLQKSRKFYYNSSRSRGSSSTFQKPNTVVIQVETFSNKLSETISMNRFKHAYPMAKGLFTRDLSIIPLAGRLSHFSKEWEILTKDKEILSIVKVYKILFLSIPHHVKTPGPVYMTKTKAQTIENGIKELLGKGATRKVENTSGEFLSNMVLVKKKDERTYVGDFIPYQNFKMEDLHCLKYMLEENDFLYKINLEDVYFSVPLRKRS